MAQTPSPTHPDLAYIADGSERHKLDLYLPPKDLHAEGAARPSPLIVYIHGGAFAFGDRRSDLIPRRLLGKGYAIASLDYRLSGDAVFPAAVEDCKAAVRWLRAHAAEYGLDPDRFAAWGESAGGNLAALVGTTGAKSAFDVGENLGVSSAVSAVVDLYGPTDFLQMDAQAIPGHAWHGAADSPGSKYVGGPLAERKDAVRRANPITYVSRRSPAFFVAHGTRDHVVPFGQSELLVAALRKARVPVTFHPVEGTDHVFGGITPEQGAALDAATDAFLAEWLAKPKR